MAAINPLPPVTPSHSTYASRLGDATLDRTNRSPLLMDTLCDPAQAAATPAALRNDVTSQDDDDTTVFAMFRPNPLDPTGAPLMECFFSARRETTQMGRAHEAHHGQDYVFTSDVRQGQLPPVRVLEPGLFNRANNGFPIRCQDTDALSAAFLADPNLQVFGPHVAGGGVNDLIVRHMAPVPAVLAPLVLNPAVPLTPKRAFLLAIPAIEAAGVTDQCAGFINFLRASLTCAATVDGQANRSPVIRPRLLLAEMTPGLLESRLRLCTAQIGGFGTTTAEVASGQINNTLQLIYQQQVIAEQNESERRVETAAKTPSQVFPGSMPKILALAQISHQDSLQQVWRDMAFAGKKNYRPVFQQAINSQARYGLPRRLRLNSLSRPKIGRRKLAQRFHQSDPSLWHHYIPLGHSFRERFTPHVRHGKTMGFGQRVRKSVI